MKFTVLLGLEKSHRLAGYAAFFGLLALCLCGRAAKADDGIFPSAPVARPFIDFDGKGFLIRGKRAFIASGSMHYSRVPRALWRDRLLRIKRAGFNTVETYAFWNFHEMQEGKWDFAGDKDVNAYLKLIKELGMYAIVRVGPYVCAEWDSGGYPVWLRFKPGVRVREDNPSFEAAVGAWYDKIVPIVAANQIHRGGAVILVQLENEHPQGWGREMPSNYFKFLRDKALARGLEVPYFFSGLHHGHDPAGRQPWDSRDRANPWMTTEFWPGWYDLYGPLAADQLRQYVRGTWKILAYGGNGYNFYMLHGGTNFATWNNDEDASNYDYGAAIGQTGDLRPIYYEFKRANLFAQSFADVLENSENATEQYREPAAGSGLRVTARKSPAGTLIFLDNNTNKPIHHSGLTLRPGEIAPLVRGYKLLPDVTLAEANTRILGIARQGDMTTLVVYGYPRSAGSLSASEDAIPAEQPELRFALSGGKEVQFLEGASAFSRPAGNAQALTLKPEIAQSPVQSYVFQIGKAKIRVVAMAANFADQTWFAEANGKPYVITGFEYVGDVMQKDGRLRVVGERFGTGVSRNEAKSGNALAYGADVKPLILPLTPPALDAAIEPPALRGWQMRRADAEAAQTVVTDNWTNSPQPAQMGADGDTSAYAWYRAVLPSGANGAANLRFSATGDWMAVWVNGQRVPLTGDSAKPRQSVTPVERVVSVPLQAGDNALAVLTAHYGRDKLFGHLGPIDNVNQKGLSGPVFLVKRAGSHQAVTGWKWKMADVGASGPSPSLAPDFGSDASGWEALASPNQDVFNRQRGFAWFTTTLNGTTGNGATGAYWKLRFENVDDNATVYLNGKKVGEHKGWGQPFDVRLDGAWQEKGSNRLTVLVENTDNTGGITGPVTLQSTHPGDEVEVRGWKMRGGIGDLANIVGKTGTGAIWEAMTSAADASAPAFLPTLPIPAFYRAEFAAAPPAVTGPHPILRVTLDGLSRGFIWLNGHNLGRYPEKVPIKSLYLPECWLNKSGNSLIIFDEEGNSPAQVRIVTEAASSRTVSEYTAK